MKTQQQRTTYLQQHSSVQHTDGPLPAVPLHGLGDFLRRQALDLRPDDRVQRLKPAERVLTENLRAQHRPIYLAVLTDDFAAEPLDDLLERRRSGNVRFVTELVTVDHGGAELLQPRGDRRFPAGDAAGEADDVGGAALFLLAALLRRLPETSEGVVAQRRRADFVLVEDFVRFHVRFFAAGRTVVYR